MRSFAVLLTLVAFTALADNPCETKCNQQASECMKTCAGDPKDASKPGESKRLMQCVGSCQQTTKQCKQACTPPPPK